MFKLEDGTLIQTRNVCVVYYDDKLDSWYITMLNGNLIRITEDDYEKLNNE